MTLCSSSARGGAARPKARGHDGPVVWSRRSWRWARAPGRPLPAVPGEIESGRGEAQDACMASQDIEADLIRSPTTVRLKSE